VRALFAASHPVSRSASKVVLYSQFGGRGSARSTLHLESQTCQVIFFLLCRVFCAGEGFFFWIRFSVPSVFVLLCQVFFSVQFSSVAGFSLPFFFKHKDGYKYRTYHKTYI